LRRVSSDVVILLFGVAVLLVWAGLVESFLSQYHEPAVPYAFKTALGVVELVLVVLLLSRSGRRTPQAVRERSGRADGGTAGAAP
jgi:hypothetical protein